MATDEWRVLVEAAYARGREVWPDVSLDRSELESALRARLGDANAPTLDKLHASDLYLALACARGDARALAHFERAFMNAVPAAIAHVAKDANARDEVTQRLRHKLFVATPERAPKIVDYSGRGPLAGWLRVAAVREALNLVRGEGSGPSEVDVDDVSPPAKARDPELALVRARHGSELVEAFREAVAALPDEDRTMLRMHYVDGLDIEAVGRVFGVHRSTASRWLAKTRERVLQDTRRRVRERLGANESEVESVLRLAQSDLDLTLSRALS